MKITSAKFVKGVVGDEGNVHDEVPQVAFVGRSNVGKSSVINSLTDHKGLAKSSATAGRTKEINFFLINKAFYLVDLPGYGFAQGSRDAREQIQRLIYWYLTHPEIQQRKIVLIIDAKVGVTKSDEEMLQLLHEQSKKVVVIANKVDKLNRSEQQKQMKAIEEKVKFYRVIPYSAEKKIGVGELLREIL